MMWSLKLTIIDKIIIEISEGRCEPFEIISDDELQIHCNFKTKNDAIKFVSSQLQKLKDKSKNVNRPRGTKGGRPKKLDDEKYQFAMRLYNQKKLSVIAICDMVGISKPTLYKYLRGDHKT